MKEVKLEAKIDIAEIEEAIQKVLLLKDLLKEANSLIRELTSTELELDIEL